MIETKPGGQPNTKSEKKLKKAVEDAITHMRKLLNSFAEIIKCIKEKREVPMIFVINLTDNIHDGYVKQLVPAILLDDLSKFIESDFKSIGEAEMKRLELLKETMEKFIDSEEKDEANYIKK
jgi:coenzyme F420-reducing hydrogenase alpha subunit